MENVLIQALEGQGIWTICAVVLTLYVLKTTNIREIRSLQREDKLHEIIRNLTEKFGIVEDVKQDVEDIKNKLNRK